MSGSVPAGTGRRVLLQVREPFALAPLRAFLAAHAVPGLEAHDSVSGSHTRLLRSGDGTRRVTVRLGGLLDGGLAVDVDGAASDGVVRTLRRWLDLDAPPGVDEHLRQDPLLAPWVRRRPGLRVPGSPDPFETAVLAVLGQQVSLGAARTFAARLVAGARGSGHAPGTAPGGPGAGLGLLPDASALAAMGEARVRAVTGVTGARARTLVALATAVRDGLDLAAALPGGAEHREAVEEVSRRLLEVPGIGPWTVGYVRMRALRDPDAFLAGDLVLRRALGGGTPAAVSARAEAWRPYRAYATLHVWTEAVPLLRGEAPAPAERGEPLERPS